MSGTGQSPEKFRRYRARLKARGLRQIQLWVPDTTDPDFPRKIRQQVRRLERAPEERDSLEFIERVADWDEETSE